MAQFDRIYYQGKKNHFTLLGASEMSKFDYLYGVSSEKKNSAIKRTNNDDDSSSDEEEEEEENQEDLHKKLGIEPDDIHHSQKVVLQR